MARGRRKVIAAPAALGFFLWLIAATAMADAVHHVAPGATEPHSGDETRPWPTLEAALASGVVRGGDEIRLAAGDHGAVALRGVAFDEPVSIRPAPGAAVRFRSLLIAESRGLRIENIGVWPDEPLDRDLIAVDAKSEAIVLSGLDIRSRPDAENYFDWSLEDWPKNRRSGVALLGADLALEDSVVTGFAHAISVTGPRARVIGNKVLGFSGDGMRGLGDDGLFLRNVVQDCVKVDDNHDDGFQSWSVGPDRRPGVGIVRGLTIDGNSFLEWTGPEDHPLRCTLQGIGLFDGMYHDLLIRNNVVWVSAWHGITVMGAVNARIVNNTVVDRDGPGRNRPWISVRPHKRGAASERIVVANNIVPRIILDGVAPGELTTERNLLTRYPLMVLRAPHEGDFRPTDEGGAIDSGEPRHAPPHDIAGGPRPLGAAPDIGAWEVR